MKIEQATPSAIADLQKTMAPRVGGAKYLEEAAQEMASAVHTQFEESVVLGRVFLTVPFDDLPQTNKEFVTRLAESTGHAPGLKPTTPVLSLVGTHGQAPDWNDRRKSKGHTGIPLISSDFVGAIPMISRLLKELDVPLDWIDSHDSEIIKAALDHSESLFFVDDAAEAKDHEGRKIIAAQDFVAAHGVKSVFGNAEAYPNGQMVVMVAFCRDAFPRAVAERFLKLVRWFKVQTTSLVEAEKIFA